MSASDADWPTQFAGLHEDVGHMYASLMSGREEELRCAVRRLRSENLALRAGICLEGENLPASGADEAVERPGIRRMDEGEIPGAVSSEVIAARTHDAGEVERATSNIIAVLLPKVDEVGGELSSISSKIAALATGFHPPKSCDITCDITLPSEQFQVWPDWKFEMSNGKCHAAQVQHFEDFDEWISDVFDKRADKLRRDSSSYQPNLQSPCIIHPDSTPRLVWEVMSMVLLMYDLIAIPLMTFNPQGLLTDVMGWTTSVFWAIDMLLMFRIGYYEKTGAIVLRGDRIFRQYLRTWLMIDVLVLIIDWSFMTGVSSSSFFKYGKLMRGLRLLRLLRLLRVMKMKNIAEEFQMHVNSEYASLVFGVVSYLLVILLLGHFIACAWFGLGNVVSGVGSGSWVDEYLFRDRGAFTQYMASLHWSLTQFTPASMPVQPQSDHERVFAICVVIFGLIVYGTFVSSITSTMTHLRELSARRNTQFWKLRRFLTDRQISRRLTLRITKYLTIMASRQSEHVHENQVDILSLLSTPLRQRLNREVYAPKLEIHPLFELLSKHRRTTFMALCSGALTQDQFSKGDVLFHSNVAAVGMFFVSDGSCIYIPADQSVPPTIMTRGSWFTEAVLWMPWVHRGTMCAYEVTTAVELHGKKFREVMHLYPDDVEIAQEYAAAFVTRLQETEDSQVLDTEPDADAVNNILAGASFRSGLSG